ncbi:amino acid adenylation domain-containing protein [Aliikangiella marina]|uniref:Amino acid adenylation domain-containing protein n=1 Tax=Aliikangiella marina TaxID=1712262 RepID=A0A545TJN0_9GAMM|nr:amino acid adenylation domain-containing protein [Aliikangiella marina]TQV77386.1 amino acid adenylation domain-containing protein [Aliikangiella marina]
MNNNPFSRKTQPSNIHKLFEQYAITNPDNIAVKYSGESITYSVLNARANNLASHLKAKNVGVSDIVALEMSHTIEFVVSIIAILKCGAAYLPIDSQLPIHRIEKYLDIAKVKLLIANKTSQVSSLSTLPIILFEEKGLFEQELSEFQSINGEPDSRAYVMFTSGSTGDPKGVEVPHRAVIRLVKETNYISVAETDCILQFAPANFDASTFEFWGALLNGACVALYSGKGLDPNRLKQDLVNNNVTILWLTAALFHLVADKFIDVLRPLRVLLAGGDVLSAKYIRKVINQFPDITMINGYGPTENTTFTCCHKMTKNNLPDTNVPIGKAITGTNVFILDENFNPVKDGRLGELYTSGSGVALGYLNDSNNQNFFYNDKIDTGLIYRTGDLVARNENGEILFHGRKDNQVKIRGYRVSLEEVKSAIVKVKEVVDAIVTTKKYESGDQILVAYIQVKEEHELSPKSIKSMLAKILPDYMIPDSFIFSESLPINNNGKVDKKLMSTT